jgi:hypothetical protein
MAGTASRTCADAAMFSPASVGVRNALKALAAETDICSSILTGKILVNAHVKLGAFGLDDLLDMNVGGYGEDAQDRAHLEDAARNRVHAARGFPTSTPPS